MVEAVAATSHEEARRIRLPPVADRVTVALRAFHDAWRVVVHLRLFWPWLRRSYRTLRCWVGTLGTLTSPRDQAETADPTALGHKLVARVEAVAATWHEAARRLRLPPVAEHITVALHVLSYGVWKVVVHLRLFWL